MNSGTKMALFFLAGAAVGAGGLCYLNRNKMDFSHWKPMATNLLTKGINLKDSVTAKVAEMKEDLEDMAAEARDRVDAAKISTAENKESSH